MVTRKQDHSLLLKPNPEEGHCSGQWDGAVWAVGAVSRVNRFDGST